MKKRKKFRVVFWVCFIFLCLSFVCSVSAWALVNTHTVELDFLTDSMNTIIHTDCAADEWTDIDNWIIYPETNSRSIEYTGIMSEKKAFLSTFSNSNLELRFIDEDGNITIDSITLEPQRDTEKSVDLSTLKSNHKYTVQYRCSESGDYALNLY